MNNIMYKRQIALIESKLSYAGIDQLGGYFVAGGLMTSVFTRNTINDIDIYPKSHIDTVRILQHLRSSATITFATEKSAFFIKGSESECKINVVYFDIFESAEKIFSTYDFTVNMAAYDVDSKTIITHESFLLDNAAKTIVFNKQTKFPFISLLRLFKYKDKGFHVSKKTTMQVILSCCNLNITSYKELSEQIGGVYGNIVESLFDENEPFSIDKAIDKLGNLESETLSNPEWNYDNSEADLNKYISTIQKSIYKSCKIIDFLSTIYFIDESNNSLVEIEDPDSITEDMMYYGDFKVSFYKWVKKTNISTIFTSFYTPSYEYRFGEECTPKNNHQYLYGTINKKRINNIAYSSSKDNALIRIEVNSKDVVSYDKFKKGVFQEVMNADNLNVVESELDIFDIIDLI